MKTKIPLNYNTDTTPLGEPCQQAQTLRSGKITNGAMNSGPVRFSNGLTGLQRGTRFQEAIEPVH